MFLSFILNKTYTINVQVVDAEMLTHNIQVVVTIYRNFWWFLKQRYRVMDAAVKLQTQQDFTKYSVQNDYFNFNEVEKNIINELESVKIICTTCRICMK
jgi:hypothetical protein